MPDAVVFPGQGIHALLTRSASLSRRITGINCDSVPPAHQYIDSREFAFVLTKVLWWKLWVTGNTGWAFNHAVSLIRTCAANQITLVLT